MGRVLLLNPPGDQLYLRDQHCSSVSKASYYWPPVDLIILSGLLSEEHEVFVKDAIVENVGSKDCLEYIKQVNPEAIIFLTGIGSWLSDFAFMERAKEITGSLLIASGGFLRHDFRQVMEQHSALDAVLLDYTSPAILAFLRGEEELKDICIRRKGEIILFPYSDLKEFSIPVPRHELFPLNKYRLPHARYRPFTSVLTNYGCPYECSYCIAETINFKYRPLENVLPELDKVASLGIREVFFKDFTFGLPKRIARELCEEIIKRYPMLSWICSSRVNVLDEQMLCLMKKAGCHTIQFGVESASQEILDSNNKKIELAQIREVFAICHRLGIKTLAHFIMGLPGETEESLQKTIDFSKEIKCDYASFNVAIPIPGTTLRRRCEENNWIVGEQEELDSSRGYPVIETSLLSREKLWRYRNKALRSFYLRPKYVMEKLSSVRSPQDFIEMSREGISLLGSIKD